MSLAYRMEKLRHNHTFGGCWGSRLGESCWKTGSIYQSQTHDTAVTCLGTRPTEMLSMFAKGLGKHAAGGATRTLPGGTQHTCKNEQASICEEAFGYVTNMLGLPSPNQAMPPAICASPES